MAEFTLQNVLGWCKGISEAADGIVQSAHEANEREYWKGQRDALRDLGWLIQWKLDGEPEFPKLFDPVAQLDEK